MKEMGIFVWFLELCKERFLEVTKSWVKDYMFALASVENGGFYLGLLGLDPLQK